MDRSRLLLWLFVILAILAGSLMSAMFSVGPRADFEASRLYFAAGVLAFIAFIFMLAMLIYAFGGDAAAGGADSAGKIIFDSCVKVLPPIATLIIGFYFGAYQAGSRPQAAAPAAQAAPAAAQPASPTTPTPPAVKSTP
jgi:hypothetical protein